METKHDFTQGNILKKLVLFMVIEFAVAASCLKQTIEGDYNRVSVDDVNKLVNSCGNGRVER